jgi:hypothetical protein
MAEDQTYATRVSTLGNRHGSRSRRYISPPCPFKMNSDGIAAGFSMTYKLLVDPTVRSPIGVCGTDCSFVWLVLNVLINRF